MHSISKLGSLQNILLARVPTVVLLMMHNFI